MKKKKKDKKNAEAKSEENRILWAMQYVWLTFEFHVHMTDTRTLNEI